MQSPSRRLQVGGRFCPIQRVKLKGELFGMSRLNARFAPGHKEFLYTGVPKALNHLLSVAHHAHAVKQGSSVRDQGNKPVEVRGFHVKKW
jgi:hypothetical protein